LSVVNIIGTGIGFLIPSFFVKDDYTKDEIKTQFFKLLLVEAGISAIVFIVVVVFFKESPPTLPSLGSMVQNVDFKESCKFIFYDKRFLSLTVAFGIVNGIFNIYGSLMDDIL
jgi:FLVCR family feline leukemia virus subgroup C receptor-related protein